MYQTPMAMKLEYYGAQMNDSDDDYWQCMTITNPTADMEHVQKCLG